MVSVQVEPAGLWSPGRVLLVAPGGYQDLIEKVWSAVALRVPPGYELVVRSPSATRPRCAAPAIESARPEPRSSRHLLGSGDFGRPSSRSSLIAPRPAISVVPALTPWPPATTLARRAGTWARATLTERRRVPCGRTSSSRSGPGAKRSCNGWLSIPSAFSAEVMAHQGFDSLTVDMQHGVVDYQVAVTMLQAISTTGAMPMARVPWNDPGAPHEDPRRRRLRRHLPDGQHARRRRRRWCAPASTRRRATGAAGPCARRSTRAPTTATTPTTTSSSCR